MTLSEQDDLPAAPRLAASAEPARGIALDLTGPGALDLFAARPDVVAAGERIAAYVGANAASTVVLPELRGEREWRKRLRGQALEDSIGPDRIKLLIRLLARRGISVWIEPDLRGALPGLAAPDSIAAVQSGLTRLNQRGLADTRAELPGNAGPEYNPLHPKVRQALSLRLREATRTYAGAAPNVDGVLVRLGTGPTLLGAPESGLDDTTFALFLKDTFDQPPAGLDADAVDRFEARARFVAGAARKPWMEWRARGVAALYGELATAARRGSGRSTTILAVVTPTSGAGAVGREARRVDLAGLDPTIAWRTAGLDLDVWPTGNEAPLVLRGVGPDDEPLARDLDASPDLDAFVAARARHGLAVATVMGDEEAASRDLGEPARPVLRVAAAPIAVRVDQPLVRTLSNLDAHRIVLDPGACAELGDEVRRFSRIYRALPVVGVHSEQTPYGVTLRIASDAGKTVVALGNQTPYTTRVEAVLAIPPEATVDDIGRNVRLAPVPDPAGPGRRLVLDVPPFRVAGVRISAREVAVAALIAHPSAATLTVLKTK